MNLRRFSCVVVAAAAVLVIPAWCGRAPTATARSAETNPGRPPASRPATAPTSRPSAASRPATATRPAPGEWAERPGKPAKLAIGSLDPGSGYLFEVELVSEGAAVNTIRLSEHFATVADKQLFNECDRDHARYEAARRENPKKYKGHYNLVNPLGKGQDRRLAFATRAIRVLLPGRANPLTWNLHAKNWRRVPAKPSTQPNDRQELKFAWTLHRNANHAQPGKKPSYKKFLTVEKTYTVRKNNYSIDLSLELTNHSPLPLRVSLDQYGPTGVPREGRRNDNRRAAVAKQKGDDKKVQPLFTPVKKLLDREPGEYSKDGDDLREYEGSSAGTEPVLWIGHVNKFFGSIMYVRPFLEERIAAETWLARFYTAGIQESPGTEENPTGSRNFLTGVRIGGVEVKTEDGKPRVVPSAASLEIKPGASKRIRFDVFAGPKRRDLFSKNPLYNRLRYLDTLDFRGCWCAWTKLTLGMMWLLAALSKITLGNYGVAIFFLVACVRVVLHPLARKSQVSMMKMQKLAPLMKKLDEKYANDKQALQKEKMKLYKQQGATPLLGCLPMLLQMPIWIALWTSINAAVELRHAGLLPVWITDLAAPDAVFSWSWSEPVWLLGTSFNLNLLPLLLTVAMFLQTKLNPSMTQATPSPQQASQQKMMQYMMPIMMLFIFYNMPSGLTLYIMSSTFVGVAEQYLIRKHIRAKEDQAAIMETTVRVPGKGPRSGRPKKPKGPFWVKRG